LVELKPGGATAYMTLRYTEEHGQSTTSFTTSVEALRGLSPAQALSDGANVRFQLIRDAGTFECEGWFKGGNGSGHYLLSANPAFVTRLKSLGYDEPTPRQQFSMALENVGFELIEELKAEGYEKHTTEELVRLGTH